MIAWLREQPLDLGEVEAKVAAALRAERLAQLNALKRLAARGKASAALAWIEDFLASDEPLVVFAGHREVQELLVERFPDALHVLGRDSIQQREEAVDAFQEPGGPQLIVCAHPRRRARASRSRAPPTSPSWTSSGRRRCTTRPRTAATASASTTP